MRLIRNHAVLFPVVLIVCGCMAALLPLWARADTAEDQLRAAIMAEVLRDPRTAAIPPEELNALVDALTAQAQAQSVTAADILWHPDNFYRASPVAQARAEYFVQCDSAFSWFCLFNQAFGFAGTSSNLPAWLFILSGTLILLIPRIDKEIVGRREHEAA